MEGNRNRTWESKKKNYCRICVHTHAPHIPHSNSSDSRIILLPVFLLMLLGALRNEVGKLESKAKALQKELEAKKKDGERAEGIATSLKNQIESLREELKATQKAFRDKMDASMSKLEAEWQAKMDALNAESSNSLSSTVEALQRAHAQELEDLRVIHEDEINTLKSALQKEARQAAEDATKAENDRLRLEEELRSERKARVSSDADVAAKHANELKNLEAKHRTELEALRRSLSDGADQREAVLKQGHERELALLQAAAEKASADFTAQLASNSEALQAQARDALKAALAELEARLSSEKSSELAAKDTAHSAATAAMKAEHDDIAAKLAQDVASGKKAIAMSAEQIRDLEKQISLERAERQRREENFVLEKDQLKREHESDIRREQDTAEKREKAAVDKGHADLQQLKAEFLQVRNEMQDRLTQAQREYSVLETRWRNRESRPDDVDRIQQLEREMVEKDELVERTREEMLYFKREMLNREESYNQKFNRQPNVGVMNVLKSKDPPVTATRGPPSNKPTHALPVPPRGGAHGGGLDLGVGVGGGAGLGVGVGMGAGSSATGASRSAGIPGAKPRSK